MRSNLLFETTTVPAAKSLSELTQVLVQSGARSINTEYEGGKPSGLRWSMAMYGIEAWFAMPVRVNQVFERMRKSRRSLNKQQLVNLMMTAERVAWRQLLMWVKVQMALVDLNMAEVGQVFFPYILSGPERNAHTAWDAYKAQQKFPALEAPKS